MADTRPKCKLVGENGNIFNLMGLAAKALRRAGQEEKVKEMTDKINNTAKNYDDALNIIGEYVDVE